MTVVLLCNAKGSPGTTTSALALATAWPKDEAVLLAECDVSGGDLGAHYGLRGAPGIATLSMLVRHGLSVDDLNAHVQSLPYGVGILVGVAGAQQGIALASAWAGIARLLKNYSGLVLLDIGRINPELTAVVELINIADLVLLVAKPGVASVIHLRSTIEFFKSIPKDLELLMIGRKPYGPDEIEEATGVGVAGVISYDAHAAEAVGQGFPLPLRSKLARSAKDIAESLVVKLRPQIQFQEDVDNNEYRQVFVEDGQANRTVQYAGQLHNAAPTILLGNESYRSVVGYNCKEGSA